MISLELSMVQYNAEQSAIISAYVEEFLRAGGEISVSPLPQPKPRPYGRKPIIEKAPAQKPKPKEEPVKSSRTYDQKLIDQIATMAETMTRKQVSEAVGISVNKLHCLALRNGFTFAREITKRARDFEKDTKKAERIRAFAELRISRTVAAQKLGISANQLNRICNEYGIEYPRCRGSARTWVMA